MTKDASPESPPADHARFRWAKRITGGLLAGAAVAIGLTLLAGSTARARLAAENPAPGRLVDVGGHALHLHCLGEGSPTVILDAGLMDFSLHWAKVHDATSTLTRACAYDRAGLGWSDTGPEPRTSSTMVEELHALLANANEEGPYLLVGHSFGGVNMRLYAHRYAEDVAGMVLVDSAHEEQTVRLPALVTAAATARSQFRSLALLNSLGLMALDQDTIPARGLPPHAAARYRALLASSDYFAGAIAELDGMQASYAEVRTEGIGDFGDLPLAILTRGLGDSLAGLSDAETQVYEETWRDMQAELGKLSTDSTQILAMNSGHYVQLDEPELVVEAVRTVLEAARP